MYLWTYYDEWTVETRQVVSYQLVLYQEVYFAVYTLQPLSRLHMIA